MGADDLLDEAEITQTFQVAGNAGCGLIWEKWCEIMANVTDIELRTVARTNTPLPGHASVQEAVC